MTRTASAVRTMGLATRAQRLFAGVPRDEVPLHSTARLPLLTAVAFVLAACAGGSDASPRQSPAAPSTGTSTTWLSATPYRAGPAVSRFASGPAVVITADGTLVTAAPVDAAAPAPFLPTFVGRPISDAGRATITSEAERLGLLARKRDFRSPLALPGGVLGRLQLTTEGGPVTLIGEPDSKLLCIPPLCDPSPGTPEAFGDLWRKVVDPVPWLGGELGAESPFVPGSYALLVGPAPAPDPAVGASIVDWPLEIPLSTFGTPVAKDSHRCGIVSGTDAEMLRPALEGASQQSQWVQDPATSATFGVKVRPIFAGEDPCAETFGG